MQPINKQRFADAVLEAIAARGMTQADLARELGVTQPTISDYVNAKKTPGRNNFARLVQLLDLEPEVLTEQIDTDDLAPDDVIMVPIVGSAAAGDGFINAALRSMEIAFSRGELARLTNTGPEHLRAIKVVGDSLAPEILPNSIVVYLPIESFHGDGLYVLSMNGSEIVKRVQQLLGGALEIIPINPAYSSELLTPLPDADTPNTYRSKRTGLVATIRVIGKVVLYSKPA